MTVFKKSFLADMFTVLGEDIIEFRQPFDGLKKHRFNGWIVIEAEQDPAVVLPLELCIDR